MGSFLDKFEWGEVVERLMWPDSQVFYDPGQNITVESGEILVESALSQTFVSEGAVEPLIFGIIRAFSDPAPPVA